MTVALKCTSETTPGRLLNIDAKCKEIIFPTTMEALKNVAVNIRRASIMELVSCVAGLWLDCGLDTVRGKHRHGGNEPENIISAATSSPAPAQQPVINVIWLTLNICSGLASSPSIFTSGDRGVPDCEAVAVVMVIVGNWQLAMLCCSRGHQILCKL